MNSPQPIPAPLHPSGPGGAPARLRHLPTLGVAVVLFVLSVGLVAQFVETASERAFESMRQRGLTLSRSLAASAQATLEGTGGDLQPQIDGLRLESDLVHVEVLDADGRLLATGGSGARPPQYALDDRSPALAKVPSGRDELASGLLGEPLYLFRFPIQKHPRPGASPPAGPSPGFGARRAQAAPSARGTADDRVLGEVRLAFSPAAVIAAREDFLGQGTLLAVLAVLVGTLFTHVIGRRMVGEPASRLAAAAADIAQGDLTRRAGPPPPGDLGAIVREFDRMGAALETMMRQVRQSAEQVGEVVEEVKASADVVVAGTLNQKASTHTISEAAGAMNVSIRKVVDGAGSLSASSEETSSSILAMVASIDEVAGHADGLTLSVNDTSATTEEMVSAIKDIDRNVEMLDRFAAETSDAMTHMGGVIHQVERNAADSKTITELVAQNAEKGRRAVELTIEGMDGIRSSVQGSSRAIEAVGRRGQEIGLILNVIQEVTEQTHLLALNAAIIAAQAGEHGRGFAVVAEEIRQLADRTATSAKEIGALIASFQSETGRAVAAMQDGSRKVEEGSERSREAGRALNEIHESARRSSTMVGEIASATREQARGSQSISASVEKVRDMVAQIKRATTEQTMGSEQIMSAVENMREMAGHVKRATVEQTRGSRTIRRAIENVTDMVNAIHRAANEQAGASDQILKVLEGFVSVNAANLATATRTREAMELLRTRTQALRREIGRFRIAS